MNNWHLICQNGWLNVIANCYSPAFPIEMRGLLASWLDRNPSFLNFDAENTCHHETIRGFLVTMILDMNPEVEAIQDHDVPSYLYKTRLKEIASTMQILFASDYLSLFKAVQQSLLKETQALQMLQNNMNQNSPASSTQTNTTMSHPRKPFDLLDERIVNEVEQAKLQCAFIVNNIREIHSKTLDLQNLQYQLQQQGPNNIYDQQVANNRAQFDKLQTEIPNLRQHTGQLFLQVLQIIEQLHPQVLDELANFKDEQRFVALGKESERNLSAIEKWFGGVYECLSSLEQSLIEFQGLISHLSPEHAMWIQTSQEKAVRLKNSMIANSLVIETQPSQIIRVNTKFGPVKLRVLIPNASIDNKDIQSLLINEEQMRSLFQNPKYQPVEAASLKPAKKYPQISKNVIEFMDIRVSEISRKVKRKEKSVVEEKFCIYFKISVSDHSRNDPFQLWITSLPIAVTSHPNQEGEAWATVIWDNAFSARNRKPFEVPSEVMWSQLIEAVNWRFLSLTSDVRRGLTRENKQYLKEKLFGNVIPVLEMVSWKQFSKDPFLQVTTKPDQGADDSGKTKKSMTFWEWIYSCHKLLSWSPDDPKLADQSLKKLWSEGKILGFMSEEAMKTLLKPANENQPGTFILRFPEKRPESIGIYYYNHTARDPTNPLVKLNPYTIKDLKEKPLQDRILNNKLVDYLYPNIEKRLAFKKTSYRDLTTIDGYVRIEVKEEFTRELLEKLKQGYADRHALDVPSPLSSHSYLAYNSSNLSPSTSGASRTRNSSAGEDQTSSSWHSIGKPSSTPDEPGVNPNFATAEWIQNTTIFDQ